MKWKMPATAPTAQMRASAVRTAWSRPPARSQRVRRRSPTQPMKKRVRHAPTALPPNRARKSPRPQSTAARRPKITAILAIPWLAPFYPR
jgi:hypothetical protein